MATTTRKRPVTRKFGGLNIEFGGFNWKSPKAFAYYVIIAIAAGALIYMAVVPPA